MHMRHAAIVVLAAVTIAASARADEVADQIQRALTAHQQHDDRAAIAALDSAAHLLRQARADRLKTFLPLPPPGWTADPIQTSAVSASAMLGGGTSASCTYRHGGEQVDIQITTDNPMLLSMAQLATSPLAVSSGVQQVTVGGRPMSYTANDNGFMALIRDKIIVKVDGSRNTSEATLRSFLASMDFDGLEKLAQ